MVNPVKWLGIQDNRTKLGRVVFAGCLFVSAWGIGAHHLSSPPLTGTTRTLAPKPIGKVNVNSAQRRELEQLPGIGPSLASAIVSFREQKGPFKSLADLDKVEGIGPKKLSRIAPHVILN
jgi:competence ComEA-like helix-hairpin-helix protein